MTLNRVLIIVREFQASFSVNFTVRKPNYYAFKNDHYKLGQRVKYTRTRKRHQLAANHRLGKGNTLPKFQVRAIKMVIFRNNLYALQGESINSNTPVTNKKNFYFADVEKKF